MPTKKRAQPILTRRERMEREAERSRQQRKSTWIFVAVGVLAVAGLVAAVMLLGGGSSGPAPGVQVPLERADHVAPGTEVQRDHIPPSSGPHFGQSAQYGVHEEPVAEGFWLHNLEHGGVVVLYNCPQGCPDLVAQLKEAYNSFPPSRNFGVVKLVAVPYPKITTRIAYLAWGKDAGWEYQADTYNRDELFRFYQAHLDKGPELAL